MASNLSNKGDSGWTGRRIDLPEFSRVVANECDYIVL